jgi:serine/threonine protein kinase
MAEIHLARALGVEGFEKLVVLKRILPEYAEDRAFVEMFLDEARLAATLDHPNIVHVSDIGTIDGKYFFAMEFLRGKDLRAIVERARATGTRIPLEHTLSILLGVCAGLAYAHQNLGPDGKQRGIIHRDVTPSNIFVTCDGNVKLLDFGIAKASSRLHETRSGTLKGKFGYMSPEQAQSLELDRRSDLFTVGIVMWELLTASRLYAYDAEFDCLKAIVERDAPSPASVVPDCPPALERIVQRALSRSKGARYQTAEELFDALDTCLRPLGLTSSPLALSSYMKRLFPEGSSPPAEIAPDLDDRLVDSIVRYAGMHDLRPRTVRGRPKIASSVPAQGEGEGAPPRRRLAVLSGVAAVLILCAGVVGVASTRTPGIVAEPRPEARPSDAALQAAHPAAAQPPLTAPAPAALPPPREVTQPAEKRPSRHFAHHRKLNPKRQIHPDAMFPE